MLSTTKAVAGFLLAAAGALALDPAAAMVTAAPACGGNNPCADQVSAVPACATGCIESAASEIGCVHGDYGCQCAKSDAIQETAILCVVNSCGMDAPAVIGAVGNLCSCVTASPTSPCTDEPPTTTSEPPVITDAPTCGGSPCSDFVSAVPACATGCIESAASEVGCAHGDYACQCASSDAIQETAILCVVNGCQMEAPNVITAVGNMCSCVTASPTTPCATATSTSTVEVIITTTTDVPEPPTTTTTLATSTITEAPECPHPCAASISAVPACATACITSAASVIGCGGEDFSCRCDSSAAIQATALNCVVGACGFGDALQVVKSVGALCSCVTASPATSCEATDRKSVV